MKGRKSINSNYTVFLAIITSFSVPSFCHMVTLMYTLQPVGGSNTSMVYCPTRKTYKRIIWSKHICSKKV